MPHFSHQERLKIALGGFISFIGLMIIIFAFLTITKTIDLTLILQNHWMITVVALVGALDIVAGVLLFKKD